MGEKRRPLRDISIALTNFSVHFPYVIRRGFTLSTILPRQQIPEGSVSDRLSLPLGERFAALRAEVLQHKKALGGDASVASTDGRANARLQQVFKHIALRASRSELFGSQLFSDPAWDLLLSGFVAALQAKKLTTSEFCASVDMPPSTAHRWINKLIQDGLLERRGDLFDGRLSWLHLTSRAIQGLNSYFDTLEAGTSAAPSRNSPSK